MMNEVWRLCVKIAGRDANKTCVIVDVIDDNYVLIDGETRRRKCNIDNLEPLSRAVEIKKGASHSEIKKVFESIGISIKDTKPKKAGQRQKKVKVNKTTVPIENDKKK